MFPHRESGGHNMLMSMTGFGRFQKSGAWGNLSVEISSVNHRFQEVSLRLPRELGGWEIPLDRQIRRAFHRGKVEVRVGVSWAPALRAASVREDVLEKYMRSVEAVGEKLGLARSGSLESYLGLPGVLESGEAQENARGQLEEDLQDALVQAVEAWQTMRRSEGKHLEEDLLGHLTAYQGRLDEIRSLWPGARDEALRSMATRLQALLDQSGLRLDEARFAQEAALLADRWDVAEELSRSDSHIAQFRSVITEEGGVGRKLDFLTQEMNREVNTMGSKVSDGRIRWLVVEAKADLERMREQIQNVE